MILLLGATGYIGQAFARELRQRGCPFVPLSRQAFDYTCFELLLAYVTRARPRFIVNAAGYSGRPNMDACETNRKAAFALNAVFPETVARVCRSAGLPWGHVSSGCIYSGAKIFESGRARIERDLNQPELRALFETHPGKFSGFTELDEPNFSFRNFPCGVVSGTKALGEEALRGEDRVYIWRPRMPFSHIDEPCGWLSRLQNYPKVYDHITSVSHLDEFARACLDLTERRAPYGIYNVVNPGAVTTREVVEMIRRILGPDREFEFWKDDREFYAQGARAPRSACILDASKLLRCGVKLRPVREAIEDCLRRWQPSPGTGNGGIIPENRGPSYEMSPAPRVFPMSGIS